MKRKFMVLRSKSMALGRELSSKKRKISYPVLVAKSVNSRERSISRYN